MAALGTTARLVQLSISAKIGMTSPAKRDVRVGGGETEPSPARGIPAQDHQGLVLLSGTRLRLEGACPEEAARIRCAP